MVFMIKKQMIKKKLQTKNKYKWTNTCEYIILHHTATQEGTLQGVLNAFTWSRKVSAHYVVDTNWDIYQIWEEKDILRHCWVSAYNWRTDLNRYAIWIEVIWPLSDWWFTQEQKEKTKLLIQNIMKRYNIPSNRVIRHADITPRKRDISTSFYEPMTRKQYQDSLLFWDKKMTEKEKEMLIISLMNMNSVLYENIKSQEIKDALAKVNSLFRASWFDNKK